MTRAQLIEQFVDTISQFEDVDASPHRFGGTEFNVGKVEIGHVHRNNGMVDIPFTVKIRQALVSEGQAQEHHLLKESGWITFFIRDEETLQQAIWLMRLSYLQKTSRRRGLDAEAVASLNLSDAVQQASFPRLS
ncbi:MAG: luciferase family protein [Chloroflexota bacterium]